MEIVKQNCNYTITDTHENWKLSGNVSKEVNGNININFSVYSTGELSSEVGYYNVSKGTDKVNVSYSVSDANKEAFITYADSVVNNVLTSITE